MEKSLKHRLRGLVSKATLKTIAYNTNHIKNSNNQSLTIHDLFGIDDVQPESGYLVSGSTVIVTDEVVSGLNSDQTALVHALASYLNGDHDIPFFTVQGGGGTGKSYSIYRILSLLDPSTVSAATPSHAAKNVLQDFLGDTFAVRTIASLLGKKTSYNSEGKQILVPNRKVIHPPIIESKVVIIDECSMVDDATAAELIIYCDAIDAKLIVMGDYAQLPPVGQHTDSLFFENIGAELLETMRFKGDILNLTTGIRESIDIIRNDGIANKHVLNRVTNREGAIGDDGSGYVFYQDTKRFLISALAKFKLNKDKNFVRIIAFRNKTILKLNKSIRLGLYGTDAHEFEEGEILICNGGYVEKETRINEAGNTVEVITNKVYNGKVVVVRKVKSVVMELNGIHFDAYNLYYDDKSKPVPVLAESSKEKFEEVRKELVARAYKREIAWDQVEAFENHFARFDYAYAVNTHKVQGNTIRHVYILEDDILDVRPTTTKEKLQAIYVGVSRASFRVYVGNENFVPINKNVNLEHFKLI